jgi:hypothetical protein
MRAKGDVIRQTGAAHRLWSLQDGASFSHKRPVVSYPELGQHAQRHSDICAVAMHIRERKHDIIDGTKQRYLIACLLVIVLQDRANDLAWLNHIGSHSSGRGSLVASLAF